MILLVSLLGAVLDRLRGYNPADWYLQRGLAAPKLAVIVGNITSRGIIAILFSAIVASVSYLYDDHNWAWYHVGVFLTLVLGLWIGGGQGRSRTYSAYNGKNSSDKDFTRVVGVLIPGDNSVINRIRGMIEAAFYGTFLATLTYVYLFFVGGHGDAVFNFAAYLMTRGVGKGLVSLVPEKITFPDIDWENKRIIMTKDAEMRNPIAECIDGFVLMYWLVYTII